MGQIIINLELFVHFPHTRSLLSKHIWPRSLERSTCDFQHAEYKTQEEIRHCPISQDSTEGPWYRAHAPETPVMPFRKKNCPAAWLSSDGNMQIWVFDTKIPSAPLEKENNQSAYNQN